MKKILLIISLAFQSFASQTNDPKLIALTLVEKELIYLTQLVKSQSVIKKNGPLKKNLMPLIFIEQYIINDGLSEYALDLIQKYTNASLDKTIADCLVWRAIDFDIRYSKNTYAWSTVETKLSSKHATSVNTSLSSKISMCLSHISLGWKWIGPSYKYNEKIERKAMQIAKNGLDLVSALKEQKEDL